MKYRAIPIVLSVIIVLSLAIVACGGSPVFRLENLLLSKDPLYVGEVETISVSVWNDGGAGGTCTVNFSIGGEEFTREVVVDPDEMETVNLQYTPQSAGDYAVTVDGLSSSFKVKLPGPPCEVGAPTGEDEDWWWYDYEVTGGNVVVNYAMFDASYKTINCSEEQTKDPSQRICSTEFPATDMRIYFSKELTDSASRQVKIEGASFISEAFNVEFFNALTDIQLSLGEWEGGQFSNIDAIGTLYVAGNAGDVNVVVHDELGEDRSFSLSGGCKAGDMIGDFPLFAHAVAGVAPSQPIRINMPTMMTTGYASDDVIKIDPAKCGDEGCPINGSVAEATGISFCEGDGSEVAPYVGTNGELIMVATALKQSFIGFDVDFQMLLIVDIAPK